MLARFRTVLAPLLLTSIALVSACSGGRIRVAKELETIDHDALAERARLGYVGAFGELADGEERARAAARMALELGNHDEAGAFAEEQLVLARTRLLIVRLDGGDAIQLERARDELDEAARFAVRIGDEILDARLVVEAAQFLHAPKRERRRIARALTLATEADLVWGYERLFEAFKRDPTMLAALQRLRWRGYSLPGLPAGVPRLAPETFGALGPEARDLLWAEINRAAIERRRGDLERWLAALLEVDRFDPHALALAVVLEALARGELVEDEALLPDLSPTPGQPLGVQARMLQRHRAQPESRALALFRANAMLAHGTFGDAGQLLAELDSKATGKPSKREALLQELLGALVAFASGSEDGRVQFERWQRKARASKSIALADWLSNFEQEFAPEGHVEIARAADRRLVGHSRGRARPLLRLPVLASAAIDKQSRPRARDRALAGLLGRNQSLGAEFLICRERKLFDDDCRDVVTELDKLGHPSDDYPDGLDALGEAANVRASWFAAVPGLGADELPSMRERLLTYEGTRAAATTDYQSAALFAELAANRPDLARARLAQNGAILRPETRAVATMALRDLEDGLLEPRELPGLLLELPSAEIEAQWFIERWLPGDPAMIADLFPGRSRLARLARGIALARMGAYPAASGELQLATEELDGVAKGVVAGRLAFAAELAGEPVLRDRALAIADKEDPLGFMAPFVRARVAESVGADADAHAHYVQALARRPHSTLALDGALRTTPLAKLELDRVREVLFLFPDSSAHWFASDLFDAVTRGEVDGPLLTALWLAREDGDRALALGEPAARLRPTAELGIQRLLGLLQAAKTPSEAFPLASKALAWISAMPADQRLRYREFELWLTMLVGQPGELEALAEARPRQQGILEPGSRHHSVLLLAEARARGAVDDSVAWALVRDQLWSSEDPEVLAALADLYGTIDDPALAQYACLRMFERDELAIAAERCVPLWQQLGGDAPFLAVDLAYLALNDPERARTHGLDLAEFFTSASKLPGMAEDPVWLLNESLWASKQGEHQRGAELRVEQLALDPIAAEPDLIELGQARYRGPLLRQQIIDQFAPIDRRRFMLAAGSAIRSLDLIAAELYAQRLLAWLPADIDEPAEFTAQAPQLLAATRPEGQTSDAELRSSALYTLAFAELIRADLASGRMPKPAMLELLDAYSEDQGLASYERIAHEHPKSHVAKLLLMSEYSEVRMREPAIALARELIELHPYNPLVLADALPLLIGPEDIARARELLAEARLRNLDHPWLRDEALPSVLTGADDRLPHWLRTPEEFERRLARVDSAALAALGPTRRVDLETSAEAFFATDSEPNQRGLGVRQAIPGAESSELDQAEHSRVQFVIREARASRCEGLACAEPLLAEWAARNYAILWTRELELPAGKAIEFLVADGESVIDNLVIPSGGNLFVLISGSTPEDFDAFVPQLVLLRESFRPLDWSMSAAAAESLRSFGQPLPADAIRWRGRELLAAIAPEAALSCPLDDPALAKLSGDSRAELLLDLFLAANEPRQRRALLTCTSPDAPEAARLAFVSLLDEDAVVHEFGRAASKPHAERVMTDTRRVLYQAQLPAVSNPTLTTHGERPPFGLLQVIAALPDQQALALTREMLGRRDPRLRALALAASATMDYFGTSGTPSSGTVSRTEVERLREVVREGEAKDALLAVRSLMDMPGAENLASLRARADKLIAEGIADESTRGLALELAWALARQLDSKDSARLSKLAAAVTLEPGDKRLRRAEKVREAIEKIAEDQQEGRKLLRKGALPSGSERAERWAREHRSLPKPRSLEQLGEASLAELVPGREWTYVRVGNAGLFASSLEALLRRLAPANPADAYLVRTLIYDMLLQGTFAQLGEDGGLDLTEPIECVSPKGSAGFVCSARVRDRAAVLSSLATRELGDDAGVSLPLSLATDFAGLPLLLGSLPVTLHSLVEAPAEELEPDSSPEVAAERLRMVRTIAGHPLEYYATIEIHENRIVVDSEHYLFLGDRLLVFASADLAELVLREPPPGAGVLANDERFIEAVAGWQDGVALQAVDFSESLGLPALALEVVLDNLGIQFTATAAGDRKAIGDLAGLDALLPDEHVAAAALALEPEALREYFEDADLERCAKHGASAPSSPEPSPESSKRQRCGLGPDDKLPPYTLAEAASAVMLGWYPQPGDALWQSWVIVLPLDAKLRKAIKAEGAPLPSPGQLVERDGLVWQVRDDALIISSTRALAEDVLAGPALAQPSADARPFARFALDGQRAAAVVRALAERYDGGRRADYLRVIATMIGLVDHVELSGAWIGASSNEGRLSATVALNLAESQEELELIDRWLASPEVGNASKLPRRLSPADTAAPLRYRIKVDDAEQFARTAVPKDNPRISVELLAPDELRLQVLPSSAIPAGTTQALSADERERNLESTGTILASNPKIRAIANELRVAGNDAATADAIVAWVHGQIKYEITPSSLDAVTVLERGKGDCTEYALLTVTLLRAAGIPAALREGMAASGDEMVAHAWAAWHDGDRWHEVDPTAGTSSVSSGHLELEVVDVLAMISLGRFEVVAIDAGK